jgi:hypothetical protein
MPAPDKNTRMLSKLKARDLRDSPAEGLTGWTRLYARVVSSRGKGSRLAKSWLSILKA